MAVEQWAIDRKRDRALHNFDVGKKKGIEIGPLCYPLLNREIVGELFYLDHASQAEIVAKYKHDESVEIDKIPYIDFVVRDGDLRAAVEEHAPYDFLLASHVIEHVPDLIGWLKDIHAVLKTGGRLILVVPDKRFTFDIFRTVTSFEDVRLAHDERRLRPNLKSVMECLSNAVNANAWYLWEDYSTASALPRMFDNATIEKVASEQYASGAYVDTHCWTFTPWSFFDLMGELTTQSNLGFDFEYFLTTQSHDLEFYVQLVKSHGPTTSDWAALSANAKENALWPAGAAKWSEVFALRVLDVPRTWGAAVAV